MQVHSGVCLGTTRGGDETLHKVSFNKLNLASSRLMDPRDLRVTKNAYFALLTHTKQLLLVTICCTTVGIEVSFRTDARRRTDGGGRTARRGSRNSYLDF